MPQAAEGQLPQPDFLRIERPFKCTMLCCCVMINPQEASFFTPNNEFVSVVERKSLEN